MAVQNTQLINSPPLLERGLTYLGVSVDPEKLGVVTDIALTAACLPINTQTVFPLKYYTTSTFTRVALEALNQANAVGKGAEPVSIDDKLLYHALLYIIGKSLGLWFWQNTDLLMTLLSSPKVMHFICQQSWFQEFKSDLVKKVGPKVLKDIAIRIAKGRAKKYIEKNFIEPLTTIFNQKREETLAHFKESLEECIQERGELIQGLFEEGKKWACSLLKDGMSWSFLENGIDFHTKAASQMVELASPLSFRLTPKEHKSSLPFHQKILASWGVLGSLRPELATLALVNPASDVIEVIFRLIGAVVAALTGYPFTSLALTECAIRLTPGRVKKLPPVQTLTLKMQSHLLQLNQEIQAPLQKLRKNMLENGVQVIDMRELEKFSGQLVAATSYACLNITGHPLLSALSACSFVQYVGALGENFGIVKAETFASKQGYLQTLPLQVITGVALTILEIGNGEAARPALTLMGAVITMPYFSDTLVASTFYNEHVLKPIGESLVPYYRRIAQTSRVYEIVSKVTPYLPQKGWFSPVGYLQTIACGAECVIIGRAALQALRHPQAAKVKQGVMQAALKGQEVYTKKIVSSTIGYYLGGPVGALSNLAGLPKDRLTLAVGIATMGTWYLTENSLVTTLATVAVNDCLRSPVVQEKMEQAKQVAIQEISEIVCRPLDGITLLSDVVGVSIAMFTQDVASGVIASEVANRALRLPVVEAGQNALAIARAKCTIL